MNNLSVENVQLEDLGLMQSASKAVPAEQNKQNVPIIADQQQKIPLLPEEEAIKAYDPERRPPDVLLSQLHARARTVAKQVNIEAIKNSQTVSKSTTNGLATKVPLVCPCCGGQIDNEPFSLCENILELGYLGAGVPLFFEYIRFACTYLFVIGVGSGIYALITNYQATGCAWLRGLNGNDSCQSNVENYLSTTNKVNQGLDKTYAGINFGVCMVLMCLSIYFRRQQTIIDNEIDNENVTPNDYTVEVRNLPRNLTEDDVRQFFSKALQKVKGFAENGVHITKIVFAYTIDEYIELKHQLADLEDQKSELISDEQQEEQEAQTIKTKKVEEATQKQLESIDKKIMALQQKIDAYENEAKNFEQCGVCFVSFLHESEMEACMKHFKRPLIAKLTEALPCIFSSRSYNGYVVEVTRAPEPSDIYWENLSVSASSLLLRRVFTALMQIFLLAVCLIALFFISYAQQQLNTTLSSNGVSQSKITLLVQIISIAMSVVVQIINYLLRVAVYAMARYEKHSTQTLYMASVAAKLGFAQFLNTAILQLLIFNYFFGNKLSILNGLNQGIFTNAIVSCATLFITELFDPTYIYRQSQVSQIIESKGKNCALTQLQAHAYFQGPEFDIAQHYAATVRLMLFCVFYAYQLPLVTFFGLFGLIAFYSSIKYLMLRRYAQPPAFSSAISESMTDTFLELLIVTFAISCIVFERYNFGTQSNWTIAQLVLAGLYYLLDADFLFSFIIRVEYPSTSESYDEVFLYFSQDYDRSNPITQEKAQDTWLDLIDAKNGVSDTVRKEKQLKREQERSQQKKFAGIGSYAAARHKQKKKHAGAVDSHKAVRQESHLKNEATVALLGKHKKKSKKLKAADSDAVKVHPKAEIELFETNNIALVQQLSPDRPEDKISGVTNDQFIQVPTKGQRAQKNLSNNSASSEKRQGKQQNFNNSGSNSSQQEEAKELIDQ